MQQFNIGDRVRPTFLHPVDVANGLSLHMNGVVVRGQTDFDDILFVSFDHHGFDNWPMEYGQLELDEEDYAPGDIVQTVTPYLGPQAITVLEHLRKVGTISGLEADSLYRVVDLPKRISELKAAGHTIEGQWRRDSTGKKYKRYTFKVAA